MNSKKIILGQSYRHKDHPSYCWAKVVKVLPPKTLENTTNKILVKCEWSVDKDAIFGVIKYFSPRDLLDLDTPQEWLR